MNHHVDSHRLTAKRFLRAIRLFATCEDGRKVRWMFAALIAFLFAINGTSVVNSYVGRDFMTAIADRDTHGFIVQALLYLVVFAVATVLAVMSHFTEERLALLWRTHLTGRAIRSYLAEATYYRVDAANSLDNPDQRIAEDIRTFTVTTLSFVLMLLNSIFTVVAFSGVLWSISPLLFLVAVLYAAGGSLLTILLGRPLVKLNYDQFDKEANFRADLIHVREHAEAIRLAEGEDRLAERLLGRLSAVVGNFQRIIAINRNLGFFTTGYNWLIQIIPVLIVAPAFIAHEIEFGVVTQSSMAFMTLVAAFSLIVTQFQSISSFAAVVARLESLIVAIERSQGMAEFAIEFREEKERLAYDGLTLRSPDDGRTLIRELSVSIPQGTRALIRAADGAWRPFSPGRMGWIPSAIGRACCRSASSNSWPVCASSWRGRASSSSTGWAPHSAGSGSASSWTGWHRPASPPSTSDGPPIRMDLMILSSTSTRTAVGRGRTLPLRCPRSRLQGVPQDMAADPLILRTWDPPRGRRL